MAIKRWTGNVDQAWDTAGNWVGGVKPVTGDDVQFLAADYVRALATGPAADLTIASLVISYGHIAFFSSSTKTMTITGDMTVSGSGTDWQRSTMTFAVGGDFLVNTGAHINNTGHMTVAGDATFDGAGTVIDDDDMVVEGTVTFQNGADFFNSNEHGITGNTAIIFDDASMSGGYLRGLGTVTVRNGSTMTVLVSSNPSININDGTVAYLAPLDAVDEDNTTVVNINTPLTLTGFLSTGASSVIVNVNAATTLTTTNDSDFDNATFHARKDLTIIKGAGTQAVTNSKVFAYPDANVVVKNFTTPSIPVTARRVGRHRIKPRKRGLY